MTSSRLLPPRTLGGFLVAALAVFAIGYASYRSRAESAAIGRAMVVSQERLDNLSDLLSTVKDAETGQRGFLLTGEERYLEPFQIAQGGLSGKLADLRKSFVGASAAATDLDELISQTTQKMAELGQTIEMRRRGNSHAALNVMLTDKGKAAMDRIRTLGVALDRGVRDELARQTAAWSQAVELSLVISWGGSTLLLVLVAAAAVLVSRDFRAQEIEAAIRTGLANLAMVVQGEHRVSELGERVLGSLTQSYEAVVAAFWIGDGMGNFRRVASHGLARSQEDPGQIVRIGEGVVGQVARDNRPVHIAGAPPDFLDVAAGVAKGGASHVLVAPAGAGLAVDAVVAFGRFKKFDAADQELARRVAQTVGMAVRTSKDRARLEELLEETQRQAEELQTQQEELRVSNEELEEQSRALEESRARLEAQHTELEQTNRQLEEQAQELELQKAALQAARATAEQKAEELARTSQYKSEFLANMSHELRTPLNSSLILAKLLADNKDGNLSAEQVRFAATISSAGNDLLALINDILDLSKIEAGKIEVRPENVTIARVAADLRETFTPVAREKGLALAIELAPGVPATVVTDPQRLAQILKNLLSNACKFTEKGEVALRIEAGAGGGIAFHVRDTGIGIPAHQQATIFEAFRQADGSTHRRYGGTGLGLSISRDLARLLGGDVTVASTAGAGSVFTLTLPARYTAPVAVAAPAAVPAPGPARVTAAAPASPSVEDDRARLGAGSRVILIIEDDLHFAPILRDMARERGFLSIVATSADEGLAVAQEQRPSAIVLDMNLPDRSGLAVLDELKHNPRTRHIPVHVMSVADYSQQALGAGAIGYAFKPVKREDIALAFARLERKLAQEVRQVLVIEDDERQRESMTQLLGSEGVQITGVATATEALAALGRATFDCMVMDLSLPDLSGFDLLEQMSVREGAAFPPVIVYTGRSLSQDEEHRLRRYSQSIIIKDARSPERLLDEVTLFLHQVESKLPAEHQRMLRVARDREAAFDGRRVLVVEDDVRNIFALSSVLEPKGVKVEIARNGLEALAALERADKNGRAIHLVLMDIMMPEMDGLTAMREIRKRPTWQKLPIIALTAKAMRDDHEKCVSAGANDYIAKPLDVERLLSLLRVWMPK